MLGTIFPQHLVLYCTNRVSFAKVNSWTLSCRRLARNDKFAKLCLSYSPDLQIIFSNKAC